MFQHLTHFFSCFSPLLQMSFKCIRLNMQQSFCPTYRLIFKQPSEENLLCRISYYYQSFYYPKNNAINIALCWIYSVWCQWNWADNITWQPGNDLNVARKKVSKPCRKSSPKAHHFSELSWDLHSESSLSSEIIYLYSEKVQDPSKTKDITSTFWLMEYLYQLIWKHLT